jgi:hypothetical protein
MKNELDNNHVLVQTLAAAAVAFGTLLHLNWRRQRVREWVAVEESGWQWRRVGGSGGEWVAVEESGWQWRVIIAIAKAEVRDVAAEMIESLARQYAGSHSCCFCDNSIRAETGLHDRGIMLPTRQHRGRRRATHPCHPPEPCQCPPCPWL